MRFRALLLTAVLFGCSSQRSTPNVEPVEASSPSLAVAERLPLVHASAQRPLGRSLAALPETADAPLRFAVQGGEVRIAPAVARVVAREPRGPLGFYPNVLDDVDVVHAQSPEAHEEAWVLRSAKAPHVLRWTVQAPEALSLRLRERHVEAFDAAGVVRLSMVPPYLVDAHGVERDVALALETEDDHTGTVVLRVDGHDLAYPLAVDPVWTTAASFVTLRNPGNRVVAIAGGKALVVGGSRKSDGVLIAGSEVYDAATNKWATVASAPFTTEGKGLVTLTGGTKAGQVVVFQGGSSFGTALYDPSKNTWATASPSLGAVFTAKFALIAAGAKVLVPNIPSVFDPVANTWTPTGAKVFSQCENPIAIKDGRVICNEGVNEPAATQLYRPATNDWVSGPAAPTSHTFDASAVMLPDGTAMVAGGDRSFGLSTAASVAAETFDGVAWKSTANTLSQAGGTQLIVHPNGFVFAISDTLIDAYQPSTRTFLESERAPGTLGPATLLSDGSILALGKVGDVHYRMVLKSLAATCGSSWECSSGNCVSGACCSTASCASGFVCSSTLKPGVCTKVKGATCTASTDCETGVCVDGRCCDRACGGQCEACDVLGSEGTCKTIVGAPHGKRTACPNDGTTCGAQVCDGVNAAACAYPSGSVPCGTPSCSAGIESGLGACKAGKCASASKNCGAYLCDASACKSKCVADTDCSSGFYCDKATSACIPFTSLGKKCDATSPCTAGLSCTDGVCCGKTSCGAGSTCAWPGREGSCTRQNGASCGLDAECGSGKCVDGVCCDSVCNGQCEACDVPGSLGACTPVAGKPHGARTACDAPADAPCAAKLCDGTNRAACGAFVSAEVTCRNEGCVDGAVTARAVCDGKGACPAESKVSCDGFKCDASGLACLDQCTRDDQCVDGFKCAGGKCVKRAAVCSPDGTLVVDVDGKTTACAPYACKAGSCASACASTEDCRGGAVCDATSKTCVPAPSGGDDGGCAYGGPAHAANGGALLALLACLGLTRAAARRSNKEIA